MNCPICGAGESWAIAGRSEPDIARWRAEAGAVEPYSWRLCKQCGSGFPSEPPLPALLDRYWESDRLVVDKRDAAPVWQRRIAMSEAAAERSYKVFSALHSGSPGRFLDIACGLGETVRKFGDCGWEAEGIDLDASTKPFHEKHNLRTRIGRFEDEPVVDRYQIIHIAHAIYFITKPMAFLRRVRAQLTENGLFAVVISDFLAAHANAAPGYIHTFYPCRASMSYALAFAGLETVITRTIGGDIYLAARPAAPQLVRVNSDWIYWQYRTKRLRFTTFGRPYLAVRWLAKKLRDRVRSVA